MREPDERSMPDLRAIVEAHLGKPLAASVQASLWRCPVCAPDTAFTADGVSRRISLFGTFRMRWWSEPVDSLHGG